MPIRTLRLPTRRDIRLLVNLAVPITVVQVGLMMMGVVDSMMVGRVSADALAAVALGNLYFFGLAVLGMGVLMSLDPVVSQAVGYGDDEAIGRAVQRGLLMAVCVAVPVSLALLPGERLFAFAGQPESVIPIAAGYARACIPGVLPLFCFAVLRLTLQAMAMVRPVVVVVILANVLSAFLNWVFVFGNLGVPTMGAVGSGWASSIARFTLFTGLLAAAWPVLRDKLRPFRRDAFTVAPVARMLRIGVPIGLQHQLEMGAFGFTALAMGWFGSFELAAHQVAISLASLTFMMPLGVGMAGSVLVGHSVGRGDGAGARAAATTTVMAGVGVMSLTALLFLTFPQLLARLYTDAPGALALAVVLIPIAGIFQVFDGLQVVSTGVLRGIGDTRVPLVINLMGYWLIGIPFGLWLAFRTSVGPAGLWWGLTLGLVVVSILLVLRVRVRFGREIERLVVEGR